MSTDASPLSQADPEAITSLFERDPATLTNVDLDRLIAELRSRADKHKAEVAAAEAKPKTTRSRKGEIADAAAAALADKPIAELSLDDLMGPKL